MRLERSPFDPVLLRCDDDKCITAHECTTKEVTTAYVDEYKLEVVARCPKCGGKMHFCEKHSADPERIEQKLKVKI
jgi:aspartate carbamoyltransferase regulatory subunit